MAMLGTILSGASSIYGLKGQYGGSSNSGGYYSPSLKASQQSNLVRDGRFVRNTIRSNKWGI